VCGFEPTSLTISASRPLKSAQESLPGVALRVSQQKLAGAHEPVNKSSGALRTEVAAEMNPHSYPIYEFGSFRLDPREKTLCCGGDVVSLTPTAFDLLQALVENHGHLLGKDDLLKMIWQDRFVEEGNLARAISTLRKALEDDLDHPKFIQTVPRRGYRFVADVRTVPSVNEAPRLGETRAWSRTTVEQVEEVEQPQRPLPAEQPADAIIPSPTIPATRVSTGTTAAATNEDTSARPDSLLDIGRSSKRSVESLGKNVGKKRLLLGVAVSLALVAVWLVSSRLAKDSTNATIDKMTIARLTNEGNVRHACISPDGRYLAYVSVDGSHQELWLKQLGTGQRLQLVGSAEVRYFKPTFSHDGDSVFYVQRPGSTHWGVLYRMASLGGSHQKLLDRLNSPVALSPDDSQLAFVRETPTEGKSELLLAPTDGSWERSLIARTMPEAVSIEGIAWSRNGREVNYGSQSFAAGRSGIQIRKIELASGRDDSVFLHKWVSIRWFSWLQDDTNLVVSACDSPATMFHQLWLVSKQNENRHRLTNDLNEYRGISITRDSRQLATVRMELTSNLWVAPFDNLSLGKQITFAAGSYIGAKGVSWTPERKIVFASNVGGPMKLWVSDEFGNNPRPLTMPPGEDQNPSVSADGRYMVFESTRADTRNIWRMDLIDGSLKRMTFGDLEEDPRLSNDGKRIIYCALRSGKKTLWKMSIDGSDSVELSPKAAEYPAISPDGNHIVCYSLPEANQRGLRVTVLPIDGGEPSKVFTLAVSAERLLRWSPDGRSIVYVTTNGSNSYLMAQPMDGGDPRLLTDFGKDRVFAFDWSMDGKTLAVSRGELKSDAMLISNFRSE